MPPRIYSDVGAFNQLKHAVTLHEAAGRTTSAAFLLWFLETIYRMDDVAAEDAVCDGPNDEGVDALAVDDDQRQIVLFQAKWKEQLPGTLGDTDLKKFVGSRTNFVDKSAVERLINTTSSIELKRLLINNHVSDKLGQGYDLHTIFITNVTADAAGRKYIAAAESAGTPLDVWDLNRLAPVLKQLAAVDWFVSQPAKLKLSPRKFFVDGLSTNPRMVVGAVPATELVRLPGISDTRIFAQNVRLSLGRTRVNKEIESSVEDKAEHNDFLTFHNGLTVVAQHLSVRGGRLTMSDYSVCNGCQSLMVFFNNSKRLTPNLEVIVRFVRIDAKRELAASIAYRTNNQNPVTLRDQSANDATQLHLKAEFDGYFGEEATYGIKSGFAPTFTTPPGVSELLNEAAGQLLLALYVGEPSSAHQKFRVFGNLRGKIFRYGVAAPHIRLAQLMTAEVASSLGGIADERIRKYGLTRFLVLYLVGEMLRQEDDGIKLLENPLPYLRVRGGVGEAR